MWQLVLIVVLFFSGLLNAQTKGTSNESQAAEFSTCQVTLTGSPRYTATISKGVVRDVNGNKWMLPPSVTIPKGGKIAVTATAVTAGAITALPGQINIIETPTAGWISVVNKSAAIPGQSTEARCQQALGRTTDHLFAFEGFYVNGCDNDCFQRLIPVYSNGEIDVFVDQRSLDQAIAFHLRNGNFGAHLYFVYRDESARQRAIASICAGRSANAPSCMDKLKALKYVLMDVDYYKTGLFGVVTPDGKPVPGPVLSVKGSIYLAPTACQAADSVLKGYRGYPGPLNETIWASHDGIGTETYAFMNESNSPRWSLLLGDLTPLRTKIGFAAININREQTPLLYQVLLNVDQKIAEGMMPSRANQP